MKIKPFELNLTDQDLGYFSGLVTGWFPAYNSENRQNISWNLKSIKPEFKNSGVYFIKKNRELLYCGFSATQLIKTITRHFQRQNDNDGRQERTNYIYNRDKYKIMIMLVPAEDAPKLESYFRTVYKFRDDSRKYGLFEGQKYKQKKSTNLHKQLTENIDVPF